MELQQRLIDFIADQTKADISKISGSTRFIDDLNLDSLDIVELMMKLEDEFGIEIPEQDTEKLSTVDDILSFIKSKKH